MPRYAGTRAARIYALCDPRCACVRYVGKSSQGDPLRRHLRDARLNPGTSYKLRWLRELLAVELEPTIEDLETGTWTIDELDAAERRWIKHYRETEQHCKLTNHRDGGEGGWDPRCQPHSAEARARMSASQRARFAALDESDPGHPKNFMDAEARAKISAANKKEANPTRAQRIAEYRRKQWEDPEYRAKMLAAGKRGSQRAKELRQRGSESGGTGSTAP